MRFDHCYSFPIFLFLQKAFCFRKQSVCGHSVSSTDRSLPGYHESGSSVLSDRWLGQGGLGPGKTSAAHDRGSSLSGAQLGQVDVQGCRRVIVGPSGGRVGGCSHLSGDIVRDGDAAALGGTHSCIPRVSRQRSLGD